MGTHSLAPRPGSLVRLGFQKWTDMRVARPLFRFGRPACVSQHLCPKKMARRRAEHVCSNPSCGQSSKGRFARRPCLPGPGFQRGRSTTTLCMSVLMMTEGLMVGDLRTGVRLFDNDG